MPIFKLILSFLCNCKFYILTLTQGQFRFQTGNIKEVKKLTTKQKKEREKYCIQKYEFS